MKKLLILIMTAAMILPLYTPVRAAYTLNEIYDSYETEYTPRPYLKPDRGFEPLDPEEIQLEKREIYFHTGEDEEPVNIGAKLMPLNCRRDKITYSSSDETVAVVDKNGTVSPKDKTGSAVITAKCGGVTSECVVNVIIGVTGVAIEQAPSVLYADRPVAVQLAAAVTPENAGNTEVTWKSSDTSIATVDKHGVVMPCGVGEVTITATTKDRGLQASCKINVTVWDKLERGDFSVTYSHYNYTLDEATDIQEQSSPTVFIDNAYPAYRDEIEYYISPMELVNGYEKYQFLDLSESNGVSAEVLDAYLNGKGVLDGMGDVFIKAAEAYGLSEVYLVVHACLESGNGTSQLASGVEYNGEVVYNMFGIGAVDASPVSGGAEYAYSNGWTSVEDAILGGAEWISKYYINNSDYRQNTLYKMRWNPESPGTHQYATDVAWASKQAETLKNMFAAFPSADMSFDYPVYKGEKELEIPKD